MSKRGEFMEMFNEDLEEAVETTEEPETVESTTITTDSGFECVIENEALEDAEMFDDLVALQHGDVPALMSLFKRLLGEEQKKALYEHCRNSRGRVLYTTLADEMKSIFEQVKKAKNS